MMKINELKLPLSVPNSPFQLELTLDHGRADGQRTDRKTLGFVELLLRS